MPASAVARLAPVGAGWLRPLPPLGTTPNQFRHTFAHQRPAEGGAEVDLMRAWPGGDRGRWWPLVIMVTANYVSANVEAARRVGADDFLVKPFDPVMLLDKAKALLS